MMVMEGPEAHLDLVLELAQRREDGLGLYLSLSLVGVCPPSPDLGLVLIRSVRTESRDDGQWRVGLDFGLDLMRLFNHKMKLDLLRGQIGSLIQFAKTHLTMFRRT